jgi:dihydrofolate reductase
LGEASYRGTPETKETHMAKVIAEMSMSLDGYVADLNDGVEEVFAWYTTGPERVETANEMEMQMTEKNAETFKEGIAGVGAVITGRRTSDLAGAWGGQHPVGVPTYVVSHRPSPEDLDPETSTVYFVDGMEEAVRRAKEAAGERSITPFLPDLENAPIHLGGPEVTEGDGVTHLHYRVAR